MSVDKRSAGQIRVFVVDGRIYPTIEEAAKAAKAQAEESQDYAPIYMANIRQSELKLIECETRPLTYSTTKDGSDAAA